jgi:hypothetical protein
VNLAATSKEVREHIPEAMRHLRETLRNLQAITTAIDSGEGLIGRILRDSTTADRLDSIVARLDRITASLEQGEGSARDAGERPGALPRDGRPHARRPHGDGEDRATTLRHRLVAERDHPAPAAQAAQA